jgi:DNA-binding CsgD family transcriptional regulator
VHAAYQESGEQIGVSIASVYNKLNGIEAKTSAALVRDTVSEKADIM